MTRTERVAFIDQQLGYGFTAADIASDLDRSPSVLERAMHRAGRHDLARLFHAIAPPSHLRNGRTCRSCGKPCSDRAASCYECIRHLSNEKRRELCA